MNDKIKLYQSVQKSYQSIGLDPKQANPTPIIYSHRTLFVAFSLMQMLISSTAFLVFKTTTVQEFVISFYALITELLVSIIFLTLLTKMSDISSLIAMSEELIEKSKCESLKIVQLKLDEWRALSHN